MPRTIGAEFIGMQIIHIILVPPTVQECDPLFTQLLACDSVIVCSTTSAFSVVKL